MLLCAFRTSTQDFGSSLFFSAQNTLAYVGVSSHVDSPYQTLLPDPGLGIIYSWCQASLVSAEILLQQTDIFKYCNTVFLNLFLMIKSYIDFI